MGLCRLLPRLLRLYTARTSSARNPPVRGQLFLLEYPTTARILATPSPSPAAPSTIYLTLPKPRPLLLRHFPNIPTIFLPKAPSSLGVACCGFSQTFAGTQEPKSRPPRPRLFLLASIYARDRRAQQQVSSAQPHGASISCSSTLHRYNPLPQWRPLPSENP